MAFQLFFLGIESSGQVTVDVGLEVFPWHGDFAASRSAGRFVPLVDKDFESCVAVEMLTWCLPDILDGLVFFEAGTALGKGIGSPVVRRRVVHLILILP